MGCDMFVPFAQALDVCDTCGGLASEHVQVDVKSEYREDLWRVLLRDGGVPSYYGGMSDSESAQILAHLGIEDPRIGLHNNRYTGAWPRRKLEMENCPIDWSMTEDPEWSSISEFAGTDQESDWIDCIVGTLACECGEVRWQRWVLRDVTMGQLIWRVVKEAQKRAE